MLKQLPRVCSAHSCIYHSFNRYLPHAYSVECIIQILLGDYPKKSLESSSEYWHYYAKSYLLIWETTRGPQSGKNRALWNLRKGVLCSGTHSDPHFSAEVLFPRKAHSWVSVQELPGAAGSHFTPFLELHASSDPSLQNGLSPLPSTVITPELFYSSAGTGPGHHLSYCCISITV